VPFPLALKNGNCLVQDQIINTYHLEGAWKTETDANGEFEMIYFEAPSLWFKSLDSSRVSVTAPDGKTIYAILSHRMCKIHWNDGAPDAAMEIGAYDILNNESAIAQQTIQVVDGKIDLGILGETADYITYTFTGGCDGTKLTLSGSLDGSSGKQTKTYSLYQTDPAVIQGVCSNTSSN
jgi:hypothetical protein